MINFENDDSVPIRKAFKLLSEKFLLDRELNACDYCKRKDACKKESLDERCSEEIAITIDETVYENFTNKEKNQNFIIGTIPLFSEKPFLSESDEIICKRMAVAGYKFMSVDSSNTAHFYKQMPTVELVNGLETVTGPSKDSNKKEHLKIPGLITSWSELFGVKITTPLFEEGGDE